MSQNGALSGLTAEELRAAVRAVLREVLPDGTVPHGAPAGAGDVVVLATDADLSAFVRRVAALCEDSGRRADLQAGRHGFRLAESSLPRGSNADSATRPHGDSSLLRGSNADSARVTRIERGAVTERVVQKAAADGARLVLGPGAVLTPLARDRARSSGVEIEKER
jgi:hypothetical protein